MGPPATFFIVNGSEPLAPIPNAGGQLNKQLSYLSFDNLNSAQPWVAIPLYVISNGLKTGHGARILTIGGSWDTHTGTSTAAATTGGLINHHKEYRFSAFRSSETADGGNTRNQTWNNTSITNALGHNNPFYDGVITNPWSVNLANMTAGTAYSTASYTPDTGVDLAGTATTGSLPSIVLGTGVSFSYGVDYSASSILDTATVTYQPNSCGVDVNISGDGTALVAYMVNPGESSTTVYSGIVQIEYLVY